MNSFYNKKKKGYTLAEVLATVAILLILMAIAVPAIFSIRKNLRQKALDNKAELIYTAVQNNLVKMQNNGNSSLYSKDKARQVTANPSDADGDKMSFLYYVTADQKEDTGNAASVLVTRDAVDDELYNNYWVVEYNPDSASVYAVFYSETRNNYDTISYNNLRTKKNRLKNGAEVGYYGGDMINGGSTSTLSPTLTITNEEKLIATISCKNPDTNDLLFEITLKDGEGHSLTLKYKPSGGNLVHQKDDLYLDGQPGGVNEEGTVRGIRYTLTLVLDDLKEEATRFYNLYGAGNNILKAYPDKQLTPGSSLTINVKVKSSGAFADEAEASATTNSLFAYNTTDTASVNKAYIQYGRHLQNLDNASGVTSKITEAIQQSDIHFEKRDDIDDSTEGTKSWYSCYKDKTFKPITNENLSSYISYNSSGDGNSSYPVIYHLTVKEQVKAGLFATLANGMSVENVRLSGTKITGAENGSVETDSTAGAIAGETAGNATITNCQVFLSSEDITGKTENDYWISGAACQGGLIGKTGGKVTISKSFAATVMGTENAEFVGGLIGAAGGDVTINDSYADSYITGKVIGGLLASADGSVSVQSCYAAGYLNPGEKGGGIAAVVNSATRATLKSCYTAVHWIVQKEGVVRFSTAPSGYTESVYFLNGGTDYSIDTEDEAKKTARGEKISYSELSNRTAMAGRLGGNFTSSVLATNAYNLKNQGLTGYSYPALTGMAHYGDWEASFEPGSLVYYEIYQDSDNNISYGFYGGNIASTLSNDKIIIGDGYGIAYEQNSAEIPEDEINITYQTGIDTETTIQIKTKETETDPVTKYTVRVNDAETYVIYPLPSSGTSDVVNAAAIPNIYYQKLVIQGKDAVGNAGTEENDSSAATEGIYYYNPHFAKTAINALEAPQIPDKIYIRTARQLYHLSLYYPDYADVLKNNALTQEVDIDYNNYYWLYAGFNETETITVQEPVGVSGTTVVPFNSVYDGGCHEIRGISFSTGATAVGFIAQNNKKVQNVFLVSDYSESSSNPYLEYQGTISAGKIVYMGALVGINSGSIQNCAVSGYAMNASTAKKVFVRSNGTFYFGGLTGSNSGIIANCEADTPQINAEILYGNAYLAGFAGENASGGRIRNSYAIGHIMIEDAKGGKTVISGFTSRNAGALNGDYCAVALTASGANTTSYGFCPRGGSISSDCSYLSGGTFRYLGQLYAFDNESGSGIKKNYSEMAVNASVDSFCHSATDSTGDYPFKTVVTDANGDAVHYGNWETAVDLGAIGVVYWELEQGGSNDGYHFSYIGYQAAEQNSTNALKEVNGSTLCVQHDDGGIITEYGYGYYYKSVEDSEPDEDSYEGGNIPKQEPAPVGFQTGDINTEASKALSNRLDGFTVVAFTTKPSIAGAAEFGRSYMQMTAVDRESINGVWNFKYQSQDYCFTINPFFANAMQYGTAEKSGAPTSLNLVEDGIALQSGTTYAMPGTSNCQYEIRSEDQLQYMNWNCKTQDAVSVITGTKTGSGTSETVTVDTEVVKGYTYLGYMYTIGNINDNNNQIGEAKYLWKQSHDIDADMTPNGTELFTPIGSLFDTKGDAVGNDARLAYAYMSYMNGSYNGNTYTIKNIEINSQGVSIGLFGSIIGANVSNLVLYSDKENYIQRRADSPKSWYVMGGLCGLAAVGKDADSGDIAITNCTVSGYTIQDNSTKGAWGDACIGGMFGMSTMDLKNCAAINDIVLNTVFVGRGADAKGDGVSVRTGGLVGSMRGKVENCYTGGEISCSDACINNAQYGYGSKIFLGGITGGICMKSGNFLKLLGNSVLGVTGWNGGNEDTAGNTKVCSVATTKISNCYTYMKMPSSDLAYGRIYSIEAIGSNGETPFENDKNYHVRVEIENCYYYDQNIKEKHRTVAAYLGVGTSGRDWTNIVGQATPLSWKQLAGQESITKDNPKDTLLSKTRLGSAFSTVTTSENGQPVDGKYSFPGNYAYLEGENYPFPTILKQGDINVHYGEWPRDGIYWEESRGDMDIFEDLQLNGGDSNDGWAVKTFNLLDRNGRLAATLKKDDFTITYSNGEEDTTATSFSVNNEEMAAVFSDGSNTDYNGDMDGFSSGTDTVSAEAADNQSEEETGTVTLSGENLIAEVTDITYDSNKGCYVATVRALKTGATIITVTVKGTDGEEYSASFNLNVSAELGVYADPETITQGVGDSAEVTVHAAPASMIENGTEATSLVEMQTSEPVAGSDGWITETDEDTSAEVFASNAASQTPEKELASLMKWETASEDPDMVECTAVSGVKFTVKSHGVSDSAVTLTVTGAYDYHGTEYTGVTWVEVKTVQYMGIKWKEESAEISLAGARTEGVTQSFYLSDQSDCLEKAPAVTDFQITAASEQQIYADDGTEVQASTGIWISSVKKAEDGMGYDVSITATTPGIYDIIFSGKGKEADTVYTATLHLNITGIDSPDQSDDTDEIISSDTELEAPGFTDSTDSWEDQSSDTVDMIPDESDNSGDDFFDETSGWES